MPIEEIINKFIEQKGYKDNKHVLGVLFYGSYLTGFNKENSDIDLHIIVDDVDPTYLCRGNEVIDGKKIEYFIKPIGDCYQTINESYQQQDNAPLLIFGKSKIIYGRDEELSKLQSHANSIFSNPLPPLSDDEAKERVVIINNRMEKLKNYSESNDPFFEHLYYLTLDKIRMFYHELKGIPRIETYKCFRLYDDENYRKSFAINEIPEQEFIDMYFRAVFSKESDISKKFQLISELYEFAKRDIELNESEYRIPFKNRNMGFEPSFDVLPKVDMPPRLEIPNLVLEKIKKFIEEQGYLRDEHCLGAIVCGSSLTGFATESSDIDLQIIFDNSDPNHLFRGAKEIDGTKIEYFERSFYDSYLSIEKDYINQNNASYSIIGMGTIVFQNGEELTKLQQYAVNRYATKMPPLTLDDAKEQVDIINNRMQKLEECAESQDPRFNYLYHLIIERIRKFYHKYLGISKIATSKVYKIYTDDAYRESIYKEIPEKEFVNMYLALVTAKCSDKEKFDMVKRFYDYATRDIKLGKNFVFRIRSRNIGQIVDSTLPKTYIKKGDHL